MTAPPIANERSFADDEALLEAVFTEALREGQGAEAVDLHRHAIALGAQRRTDKSPDADRALAALVSRLSVGEAEGLARSLTRWFQLLNRAEDNERIRRLRAGDAADPDTPREGSLRAAVTDLAAAGVGTEELTERLAGAELRLVLTAHPTETRRRTTIEKLARVFSALRELDRERPRPADVADARRRIAGTVAELWGSDEMRSAQPTVRDEVEAGLVVFKATLVHVVPAFYRELEAALAEAYPGQEIPVPPFLRFGSWIGGDRDGNPNVTPAATAEALDVMRDACLRFLERRLTLLAGRISLSERVSGRADPLERVLEAGADAFPDLAAELRRRNAEEPYRRALSLMAARVRAARAAAPGGYAAPGELLEDLRAIETALRRAGAGLVAAGDLRDVVREVEVFGFHFAQLDIRDHAGRQRRALDEIFATLGVEEDYAGLPEASQVELLAREIAARRPLIPGDTGGFEPETREVVDTFRTVHDLLDGEHAGAIESFVVSHTAGPADVLQVLLLMKECRLARAGGRDAQLRIVPLFESRATLDAAGETIGALLEQPVYREALRATGDTQEVMIGYSDSNKDAGYVASGWATYRAQVAMAERLRAAGVGWIYFHGRGGAVGRGGGPAHLAIRALPPGSVGGRLKMTEQGEVLSDKYAVTEIAERELELTASALLAGLADAPPGTQRDGDWALMDAMAERSAGAYRALVHDDPGLAAFFAAATPVGEISRLRLGSRPASRAGAGGDALEIDDLRAIPWVFSWTQARIVLPAWYGVGTALAAARAEHGLEALRELAATWPFFAALLANTEMACAKADPAIGARYAALLDDEPARERVWSALIGEYERTVDELLTIAGAERLLDAEPVLQTSIDRRNPAVDPLSYIQVELLRRARAGERGDELQRATALTVNGIASGLRNTG